MAGAKRFIDAQDMWETPGKHSCTLEGLSAASLSPLSKRDIDMQYTPEDMDLHGYPPAERRCYSFAPVAAQISGSEPRASPHFATPYTVAHSKTLLLSKPTLLCLTSTYPSRH